MPGIDDETRQLWQLCQDQYDPDPRVRIAVGDAAIRLAVEGSTAAIQAKAAELLAGLTTLRVVAIGDRQRAKALAAFAEACAR